MKLNPLTAPPYSITRRTTQAYSQPTQLYPIQNKEYLCIRMKEKLGRMAEDLET